MTYVWPQKLLNVTKLAPMKSTFNLRQVTTVVTAQIFLDQDLSRISGIFFVCLKFGRSLLFLRLLLIFFRECRFTHVWACAIFCPFFSKKLKRGTCQFQTDLQIAFFRLLTCCWSRQKNATGLSLQSAVVASCADQYSLNTQLLQYSVTPREDCCIPKP